MINEPPISSRLPVAEDFAVWPKPWANWMTQAWQILVATSQSGATAQRPTAILWIGRTYFDTTIGLPIWIQSLGPTVWIDAAGNVV